VRKRAKDEEGGAEGDVDIDDAGGFYHHCSPFLELPERVEWMLILRLQRKQQPRDGNQW
jgi:hypothetical protein